MKRFIVIQITVLIYLCLIAPVFAQERPVVRIFSHVWSKYLSCVGFDISQGDPVIQTDLSIWYRGFRFEVWHSTELEGNFRTEAGNEIDYFLAWNGAFPQGSWLEDVRIDAGIGYLDIPKMWSGTEGDIVEPFIEIWRDFPIGGNHIVSPLVRAEFNFIVDGDSNVNTYWGLRHSWVFHPNFIINHDVSVVTDNGGFSDSGALLLYRAGASWLVSEKFSLTMGLVKMTVPLFGVEDREGTKIAIGAGFNFNYEF